MSQRRFADSHEASRRTRSIDERGRKRLRQIPDIIAHLTNVTTVRNGAKDGDAGLKLREKGADNLSARIVNATSSDNLIGGILLREDGAGNLEAVLVNDFASGNNDYGIKFDENGIGSLDARIQRATAIGNVAAGVEADQQVAAGASDTGFLRIQKLTASGNGGGAVDADAGVTVEQNPKN